jgi:hypothetical protein
MDDCGVSMIGWGAKVDWVVVPGFDWMEVVGEWAAAVVNRWLTFPFVGVTLHIHVN